MKKDRKQHAKYNYVFTFLFLFVHFSLLIAPCFAFDLSFRPKAFFSIPSGSGNTDPAGNKMYSTGGGGEIGFEVDLSTVFPNPIGLGYVLGVEGGLVINPFQDDSKMNISFYSAGGVLGLYYFPLSRLFVRAEGALGTYLASNERGNSEPGLFWRAGGELGFRFTPSFLMAANAGWREYQLRENGLLNSGVYAGLTLQITFQAGSKRSEGVSASLNQHGAIYPAFSAIYQKNPIGTVSVSNNENAEIRDVRMYFRAGNYTSSEFLCGAVSIIPRGRSVNIPLLADFSNDILRFTDTGRIIGEVVIRYRFLGQEREVVRTVTAAVHDRSRVTAKDTAALAAFVSPSLPETLDFSRMIAGLEKANRRTGHNQKMSYAIWLFETMRQVIANNGQQSFFTSVQFPAETLLYRSGASHDLALLFAACLESVGIGSALISAGSEDKTESELLAAVSLGVNQSAAQTLFNGTDQILIVGDNVYLPLSMSALSEGFMAAWSRGASVLNNAFSSGEVCELVVIQEAWSIFPPAPLPELGRSNIKTDNAVLLKEVDSVFQSYIQQEINPIIQRTTAGGNTAAQQNRLGILLVRAGRIAEAKTAYERAAGMGSVPAMTNRGNLALIERDYAAAESWFRQALQSDSLNVTAQRGLERVAANRL